MVSNTSVSCARNGNGKNDINQIADNVRVVHAGCGVKPYPAYKVVQIQHIAVYW